MKEKVILVNEQDKEIGVAEKLEVHQEGRLHRAFSVFIFNEKNEMLLQQRAPDKYHSGGLWSNACCSHPVPGESLESASERRLFEEMGIRCNLKKAFHFVYKAKLNNQLIEHEFDHVFIGKYSGESVIPNPQEVMSHRWVSFETLQEEMRRFPKKFTIWFKIAVARVFRTRENFNFLFS